MVKLKRAVDTYTCQTCEQPVPARIGRHKTLGVFVPVWGPGPCQNPHCPDYRLEPKSKRPPAH
ncbi:hypothetical protein OG264_01225 [Streptomyces xanthophaeus]|nr:hypothetical protein OG264_01225 [Streptomyces xanthophaeus]WST64783.1 hypothetical protein OG605_37135 [Streptomyces xanthophaeus]